MCKSQFITAALILTATLILILSACAPVSPLSGSGNVISRDKAFSDFTSIDVNSGFEVEITQSDLYRVTIIADDNIFDNLEVVHQGDTLRIFLAPVYSFINATKKVIITMPDIYALKMSMGTEANISGFHFSHELGLDLSTGSELSGDLNAGDTDLKISEGSSIKLNGSANNIIIDASTGSTVDLEKFAINNADIKLDLGSKATLNITGELEAELSGGSSLYYVGEPVIREINSSRGCTIQHK